MKRGTLDLKVRMSNPAQGSARPSESEEQSPGLSPGFEHRGQRKTLVVAQEAVLGGQGTTSAGTAGSLHGQIKSNIEAYTSPEI